MGAMNDPIPLPTSGAARPADPSGPLGGLAPRYDVVVVGARAAGAATAMLLARRGISVLAVDRGEYGSDTLSTNSIALPGVLQLSRWGVLDTLRARGTPVGDTVVFHYGDDTVRLELPRRGDVDGLYGPRRTILDPTLVDAAVAGGAEVRHRVAVRRLTHDGTGRVDGVELAAGGETRRISARWVVGADGIGSRVAAQVGSPKLVREPRAAAFVFALWDGLPPNVVENFHAVGSAAGVIPTNDDAAVVWTAVDAERFRDSVRGRLADAHHETIGRMPALRERLQEHGARCLGGYRGFGGEPGFLRRASGPGWVLVGDASYFKDPVSAHGITDALIGAELVADAIVQVARCGADEREAFGHYADVRDGFAAAMMPPVARLAGLDLDLAAKQQAFKEVAAVMRDEYAFLAARTDALAA